MNKFTKISAAALLALFLTACDKPADKAPEAKPEATPAATPAPAATPEAPKAETPAVSAEAEQAQGVEDFKKLVDWNAAQEKALESFQNELQQKLASQDKTEVEAALKEFAVKVDEVMKSLDALEIKNAQVNEFKAKTKETLMLSNELVAESVKVMANPTEDAQKMLQEKVQKLMAIGVDLQKLQAELQQKFGAK